MTAANKMTDQHLIAEYRELPMVMGSLRRSIKAKNFPSIPKKYTLNAGHVKFFYNKKDFLKQRYSELIEEMKSRGFTPDPNRVVLWEVFDSPTVSDIQCDWKPVAEDHEVSITRISQRLREKPHFYRFRGELSGGVEMIISKMNEWNRRSNERD